MTEPTADPTEGHGSLAALMRCPIHGPKACEEMMEMMDDCVQNFFDPRVWHRFHDKFWPGCSIEGD